MATLNELLETMGINPNDVPSTTKYASARGTNHVAEYLMKVAEEAGVEQLSGGEEQAMLAEAIKALEAKMAAGEQLTPEEQQFYDQAMAELQGGAEGAEAGGSGHEEPDADNSKQASRRFYKRAEGPADLDANLKEQEGLMADVARAVDFKLKELSGPPRNGKGDERGGEDNPAAIGNRQAYDNGPAQSTSEGSKNTTLTGEKAAMARLAKVATYNKLVDQLSNWTIEKMAYDSQAVAAQNQQAYAEKVAAVREITALDEYRGQVMADSFVGRLREYGL